MSNLDRLTNLLPKSMRDRLDHALETMNVLFAYGYTNVYELGPLIDINKTIIPFKRATTVAAVTP